MENQNLNREHKIYSSFEIKNLFFLAFKDSLIEENYLTYVYKTGIWFKNFYLAIYILSHIILLIYGIYLKSSFVYFITVGICLACTITFTVIKNELNSLFHIINCEIIAYFLLWISLLSVLICFIIEKNVSETQITRIIYLLVLIKNFSLILWSRLNYILWIIPCFINIGIIIFCSFFMKNHIFEDIVVEIITSLTCFGIKIFYDSILRKNFLEREEFKNILEYYKKLINSMSGLHITFSGNKLFNINDNVKSLINKINKNKNLRRSNLLKFKNKKRTFESKTNFNLKEDDDNDMKMKQEILKSLFSKFYSLNPISLNIFKRDIPNVRQNKNNQEKNNYNESNQLMINNNNNKSIAQNLNINNNNKNNENENLNDILEKLISENINDNKDYFQLLGEFKLICNKNLKPFVDWMQSNQQFDDLRRISIINYDDDINENSNFIENELNEEEKKPFYFLVYYRISNGNLDVIIRDKTLIKNYELDEIKNNSNKKNLGKIVHEFKTPLNSIICQIENINDKYFSIGNEIDINKKKEVLIEDFNFIRSMSSYSGFLINDLMHFLGDQSEDNIQIDIVEINLKEVVIFTNEILKSLISLNTNKKNNIEISFEYDNFIDHLEVHSDEVRLKQIMLNLISNSVKFTKFGYIRISCIYIEEKKEIHLSVEDSGSGIKEEDKDLVFNDNNGRRIDLQYQNNKMGSGYGLKISHSISKKLNHLLSFESEFGRGSKFNLKINPSPSSIDKGKYLKLKDNILETGIKKLERKIFNTTMIEKLSNTFSETLLIKNRGKKKYKTSINNNNNSSFNINSSETKSLKNSSKLIIEEDEYNSDITIEEPNPKINTTNLMPILNEISEDEDSFLFSHPNYRKLNNFEEANNKYKKKKSNSNFEKINNKFEKSEINVKQNNSYSENVNKNIFHLSPNINFSLLSGEKSFNSGVIQSCFNLDLHNTIIDEILVVDDNQSLRESTVFLLRKYSEKNNKFNILEACDGKDLIRYILDDYYFNKIKYVITDENMDFINGSLAVKFLKELEGKKIIEKKIYILASSDNDDFREKGFDYSIEKPVNIKELDYIINKSKKNNKKDL